MNNVDIYTKATCGFCMRAKMLLDKLGVSYNEIKIDFESELREKMIARTGGAYTVPQIFIGDTYVGGCDDLFALYSQNKLNVLLED